MLASPPHAHPSRLLMDVLDLLRALPGLLLLGLLPGLALLTLIRPSMPRWWRLAAAPGMSIGIVGLLGLVYHRAHVPFEAATVLPAVAVLVAVAALAHRRARGHRGGATPDPARLGGRPARVVVGAGLLAGLISASVAVAVLHAQPLPPDTDSPIHAYITQAIATQHDVAVVQPVPDVSSSLVRDRVSFEATAAEVAQLTGMRPEAAMLPLVLLAVALLPLSLAMLAWEATRNWRVAALTPLLGVGFTMTSWALLFGEFPYLADATLVVLLALSARRALLGSERTRNLLLVGACVAAIWVTHGLEFITAVVVGIPFALASVRRTSNLRSLAAGAAGIGAACIVGAAAVTVLTPHPLVPAAVPPPGVTASSQAVQMLARMGPRSQMFHALSDFVNSELVAPAIVLYVLGLAASLLVRGVRWVLLLHVALLLILADVGYGGILMKLWSAVFPWSGADRVVSIQWYAVPLLMAWGLVHARTVFAPILAKTRDPRLARNLAVGLGAVTVLAVGFSVAHAEDQMGGANSRSTETSDADVAALAAMDRALPAGTLVLSDTGADGGQWIDVLTRDVEWAPLSFQRTFVAAGTIRPATDPKVAALAHACDDPAAARAALAGIGAVYVGSEQGDQEATVRWNASCIAALPGVHPLVRSTVGGRTATVYAVDPTLQAVSAGR